jgi:hypothetical protein
MLSVIIPAHNEEKVIAKSIKELVEGARNGEIEVIVVCNGCSDDTAGVVASFGPAIKCIVTTVSSKTNALNLGDAASHNFPRVYQDADVVLTLDAVRQIGKELQTGRFLAAAPQMQMDFRGASWGVRAYYCVWKHLPYVKEGMVGTGVFALSEQGRRRFDKFPQIIADDGYIRALFKPEERSSLNSCNVLVRAPTHLKGLLKIKTRSRLGGYELKKKFPGLLQQEEKSYRKAFFEVLTIPSLWPRLPVYLYVNVIARVRAKKYMQSRGFTGWERDESSREDVELK